MAVRRNQVKAEASRSRATSSASLLGDARNGKTCAP
jgi:hypothetical protein